MSRVFPRRVVWSSTDCLAAPTTNNERAVVRMKRNIERRRAHIGTIRRQVTISRQYLHEVGMILIGFNQLGANFISSDATLHYFDTIAIINATRSLASGIDEDDRADGGQDVAHNGAIGRWEWIGLEAGS